MTLVVPEKPTFNEQQHFWWWHDPASDLEVNIAGNSDGPFAEHVELAGSALDNLEQLKSSSADYISKSLGITLPPPNDWELRWLSSGVGQTGEALECELTITADDEYVLWSVRFVHVSYSGHFSPRGISRRQW